jgi:hypothetical protein
MFDFKNLIFDEIPFSYFQNCSVTLITLCNLNYTERELFFQIQVQDKYHAKAKCFDKFTKRESGRKETQCHLRNNLRQHCKAARH